MNEQSEISSIAGSNMSTDSKAQLSK